MFAERSINLSKLESRPSREAAWEYVFWADLDAHRADPNCAAAIDELGKVATMVRVFGTIGERRNPRSRSLQQPAEADPNGTNRTKCQLLALTAPIRSGRLTIRDVRDRGLIRRSLEGALERGDDGLVPTIAKGQSGIGE